MPARLYVVPASHPSVAVAKALEIKGIAFETVVEGLLDMRKVSSLRLLRILCGLVAKRLRDLDDKIVGWHILAGGGGAEAPPESS